MGSGIVSSPVTYETRINGAVACAFTINFNLPSPFPLTSIVAFNTVGSPYTQIRVTDALGNDRTFPLPTAGKKVPLTTTDSSGAPVTLQAFTATVTQAQMAAQGFTTLGDIGSFTVF